MKAHLIEDGGAVAADAEQFFRSPAFLEAEHATHTLEIDADEGAVRLPLIVRGIDGTERRDAISPYGYPGGSPALDAPPDPAAVDWSETGLVSIFVRDRIGYRSTLRDGTVRAQVHFAEGEDGIRKRLREQIRRNERRGWRVEASPGPDSPAEARAGFERAYAETMSRTGAGERYLYPGEYFDRLLRSERSWLLAARGEAEEPLAGAIAVASDGYLHYYLGGTSEEGLEDSPMKNIFAAMISLGSELGLPVNLGGGLAAGDSLDDFKRGFATGQATFRTHELICDPAAYDELSSRAGTAPGGFFPGYRA